MAEQLRPSYGWRVSILILAVVLLITGFTRSGAAQFVLVLLGLCLFPLTLVIAQLGGRRT